MRLSPEEGFYLAYALEVLKVYQKMPGTHQVQQVTPQVEQVKRDVDDIVLSLHYWHSESPYCAARSTGRAVERRSMILCRRMWHTITSEGR